MLTSRAIRFSGGLKDALPTTEIEQDELAVAVNLDYSAIQNGRTRPGYIKYNSSRFMGIGGAIRVVGLTSFAYGLGLYRDMLIGIVPGGPSVGVYRVSGTTLNPVTAGLGVTFGTNDWPFSFVNAGKRLIAMNGDTTSFIWDGSIVTNTLYTLGIAGNVAAPVVAAGAAGNLNGAYRWAYLYRDSLNDVNSNLSPLSASLNLAALQATVTVIASGNPRVNQIQIFRTRSTGQAPMRLVTTVANAGAAIADNVGDIDLGAFPQEGGQPPNTRFGAIFNGTLFLLNNPAGANFSRLYYSNPGRVEEFPAINFIDFDEDDGGPGTGLNIVANQLVVSKQHKHMHLVGTAPGNFAQQTPVSKRGMNWAYSGTMVDDALVYADIEAPYIYDASQNKKIADANDICPVQGSWSNIANTSGAQSVASQFISDEVLALHLPRRRQVLFSCADRGDTRTPANENTQTLVWNYGQAGQPWGLYDFGFDCWGLWRDNFGGFETVMIANHAAGGWVFTLEDVRIGVAVPLQDRHNGSGTSNGTVTGIAGLVLTDAGAAFYTTGDGLMDASIVVARPSTGVTQRALISLNTGTTITVSAWPTFAPAVGDVYLIAPIRTRVRTGRVNFKSLEIDKLMKELRMRQVLPSSPVAAPAPLNAFTMSLFAEGASSATLTRQLSLATADQFVSLRNASAVGKDFQFEWDGWTVDGGRQFTDVEVDFVPIRRRP